jgi:hypothetical protein
MYGYNEPLRLEEIPVPDIGPGDVNDNLAALARGDIVGRAVFVFG